MVSHHFVSQLVLFALIWLFIMGSQEQRPENVRYAFWQKTTFVPGLWRVCNSWKINAQSKQM